MKKEKQQSWKEVRKNLEKTVKKYPNLAMDCIDSAYYHGLLEATKETVKIVNKKL